MGVGGGGGGGSWVEYSLIYYIGYGFLTRFGLKPFRCEIGLGVNVPKSGSVFFLADTTFCYYSCLGNLV